MSISVVQKSIYQLLKDEPFYAHFILNSNILYDRFNVAIAGVTVIHGVPTFIFNTSFMARLTERQCKAVLKHEVLHLVLDHLNQGKKLDKQDQFIANLATDCAINQYLQDLPADCITLDAISKLCEKNLKPFETSDYYFDEIKKVQKKAEESGLETLDDHDVQAGDTGNAQVNKASVRATAQKAVQQAAGNAPQAVVEALSMAGEAQIPWKQVLRNFIMTRVTSSTLNTQKRVNRRFPSPVPGKKKKRTMTLGVCLDSSGSISDAQYMAFMTEVKSLCKNVEKTYLVHADCEVQKVETLGPTTKVTPTRYGSGGTAYQPAITKCVELGCDVILYFGDFDTSDVPVDPKRPFLWIGVGSQEAPAKFGKVLRLPA